MDDLSTQNELALLYLYAYFRVEPKEEWLDQAAKRQLVPPRNSTFESNDMSPIGNSTLLSIFMNVVGIIIRPAPNLTLQTAQMTILRSQVDVLAGLVDFSIKQRDMVKIFSDKLPASSPSIGIDEIIKGRAGLLWAVLLLRDAVKDRPHQITAVLNPLFEKIPKLVHRVVESGIRGWNSYMTTGSSPSEPADALLWPWLNREQTTHYGLGAMHGTTGILAVLLRCSRVDGIEHYYSRIANTITFLSEICIIEKGHLPMSLPRFPGEKERASPLVQLCHGAPGMAVLLAVAGMKKPFSENWKRPEWEEAQSLAHQVLWREGIVSKGLGVCHGIAGNALPMVLAAPTTTSTMLGKAMAMVLEIKNAPPMGEGERFRTPDRPFGLLEGLVGTMVVLNELILSIKILAKEDALKGEGNYTAAE